MKKELLACFLVCVLIALSLVSFAQTPSSNEGFLDRFYRQDEMRETRSWWSILFDILNIVVTLGVIVLIVYLVLKFLKKTVGAPVDDFGVIEIMASKGITQGIAIYIVRIGKDYYVMSSGDRGLNLIAKIEDKELIDILNVEKSNQARSVKEDFVDTLLSLFRKKGEKQSKALSQGRLEFLRNQRDKLRNLE